MANDTPGENVELDMITIAKFTSKVFAMRTSQRKYFLSRDYNTLRQAKELEKEVDGLTEDAIKASSRLYSRIRN